MVTAVCQKDVCPATFAHIYVISRIQILVNFNRIISILKGFAGGAGILFMTFLSMFRSFRHHYLIPFR
jgi:hypothetical protein